MNSSYVSYKPYPDNDIYRNIENYNNQILNTRIDDNNNKIIYYSTIIYSICYIIFSLGFTISKPLSFDISYILPILNILYFMLLIIEAKVDYDKSKTLRFEKYISVLLIVFSAFISSLIIFIRYGDDITGYFNQYKIRSYYFIFNFIFNFVVPMLTIFVYCLIRYFQIL